MHGKLKIKVTFLTTLLILSMMSIGNLLIAKASPETIVYVDPPEIKDLFSPATFTIYVKLLNVQNLYGLDFQFTWDPTIIRYVSHKKHIPRGATYPNGILYSPTIPVRDQVDEAASMPGAEPGTRYWLAESSMLPAAAFNGNGTILEMTFQVVGLGTSPLHITACTLANKDGNPIPATLRDGIFQNYVPPPPPPADIYINPPLIINSSLDPCHYFDVSVEMKGVQNLYSFNFWIGYNATILDVFAVTANPLFPPPTVYKEPGQVRISASLTPPATPINGNLYLTIIKFHVLAKGETTLDLHDVLLLNNEGKPIQYNEPKDSYFNNMEFFLISANVEIKPDTLNLKSFGKWIAVYIELPEGYNVGNINVSTILLNETIQADSNSIIGDFDSDSIPDLMVKFNRTDVINYINHKGFVFGEVHLTIKGELAETSVLFGGSGTIKVSSLMGDSNCDGVVNIEDIVLGGLAYNSREEDSTWNANSNFAPSYEIIDILDLVTAVAHYGKKIS